MVTTADWPDPDPGTNPLVEEAAQLNRDDSEIVAEIAALDQAEGAGEEEAPQEPVAEQPPAKPAEPPPIPGVDLNILRQQLQMTQEQLRRYEIQEQATAVDREVAQYQAQLEQQGLMEEQARPIAQQYRQFRQREMQLAQASQAAQGEMAAKFEVALRLGQAHGVDPRVLMAYDSPQAMESAATTQAELKALKSQVQKLTQARVPPSSYETGQPAPVEGRTEAAWMIAYNNGDRSPHALAAARKAAGM